MRVIQQPSIGTLRPVREESVNFDDTENLIIEGDNLEVLKLLQKSYFGQVKMIYIDPPYNTGKEFVYPDNFKEGLQDYLRSGQTDEEGFKLSANVETEGRYHSKWLNMMYPRLFLARNLLRDDGVIFISIDDHEVHNLRLLANEVFGEENFVATFVWKRKAGGGDDSGHVAAEHEYVLCYARDEAKCGLGSIMHESPAMTAKYNKEENGRRYYFERLDKTSLTYNDSMDYPIKAPDGSLIEPPQPNPERRSTIWRWSKDTVEKRRDELIFAKEAKTGEWRVYTKTFEPTEGVTPRSLLVENHHGQNRDGTQEAAEILGPKVFRNPKPLRFLRHLIAVADPQPGDIILDFFAGSGSTAHAVLSDNHDNNRGCSFILVQLPEPTSDKALPTISAIAAERVRRVVAALSSSLTGTRLGFRFFRLSLSNFRAWNGDNTSEDALQAQIESLADNTVEGRSEEDILTELMLKAGFPLTAPVEHLKVGEKSVFSVSDGALLMSLDENVTIEVIEAMVDREPQMIICLDEGFRGNDELKVNTVETVQSYNRNHETGIKFLVA